MRSNLLLLGTATVVVSLVATVSSVPARAAMRRPELAGSIPADSVIVRVTSEDGTAPATFEARYLLVGGVVAPGASPGGVVTSRQTPYTLALPATAFQGMFRQVGAARIHVEMVVRHGGRTTASTTSTAPISLMVADARGDAAATGF